MRQRKMDFNFLNVDFAQVMRTIKNVIIKIAIIPFKMFNSLPWYVKGTLFFIVFLTCLFVIYMVWKNREEWLRIHYE